MSQLVFASCHRLKSNKNNNNKNNKKGCLMVMANPLDLCHVKNRKFMVKKKVCGVVIMGILMENEQSKLFCQVYGRDWQRFVFLTLQATLLN